MAKGIDIYRYQTVTNWQAVKNSGVGYIWVKLTDGAGPAVVRGDKQVAGSKSVGIPVGGYHFCQSDGGTPERQADVFIAEVRRLGATGLVPMLDLEDNPPGSGRPDIPDSQKRAWGIRFCRRVLELGFRPGVYVNNSVAKLTRPDGWGIPGLVIWIARYGAKPDAAAGRYDVHQYSSTGSVPGITGSVDMNESYTNNHFAGSGRMATLDGDDLKNIDGLVREALYGKTGMWYGPRFRGDENYAQVLHATSADAAAAKTKAIEIEQDVAALDAKVTVGGIDYELLATKVVEKLDVAKLAKAVNDDHAARMKE